MFLILGELARHLLYEHHVIDDTGGNGAPWHALQSCRIELGLRQCKAAVLFNCPDANRSVTADTRKHDADGALATVLRQRSEERIDGPAMLPCRGWSCELQNAILDCERRIRRDDEHAVLFDRETILRCNNGNGAVRREQFDQEALVLWVEVLHQRECHAAVG